MKTNTPSRKFSYSVLATALAIVIACELSAGSAQAGYIVTLQQVGGDIVATGTGALDVADLSLSPNTFASMALIVPKSGFIDTGPTSSVLLNGYLGFSGPASFGSGLLTLANNGSGNLVGLHSASGVLLVPLGYVSGTALSDTSTYNGKTFASLQVTPGTYVWSWGTGLHADTFTLQIGPAAVPDSGSTLGLLLVSVAALFGASRLRSLRVA